MINQKIREKVKPIIQRLKSPLYKIEEEEDPAKDTGIELVSEKSSIQQSKKQIHTRNIPKASLTLSERDENSQLTNSQHEAWLHKNEVNGKKRKWKCVGIRKEKLRWRKKQKT